ncbi:hypothetical protein Nepgr_006374 [Nepenthes gracilis]|uniref:Maintenance of Photosystem II under High light 2 C-terminal domain-containing protein n=1 Tax=Nepenthes gracilis TaxID=150966 RepID=A0AAD3S4W0_NEPGR|nr:hypothetical protein Nepgr_006374 [Nepenthes gracilis]
MAVAFLYTANILLSSHLSSSYALTPSSLTTTSSSLSLSFLYKRNMRKQTLLCKTMREPHFTTSPIFLSKRGFSVSLATAFLLSLAGNGCLDANAAILEADDDEELLERVKKDRKKRIERQGVINSYKKETAYLQDLVYKLSKVGQAIENSDLNEASSVLGQSTEADWIQKANSAFTKLSSSPEEKAEVDTFNSSIGKLISSVVKKDMNVSKMAFVSSASALEKWTALTGLSEQLKGL